MKKNSVLASSFLVTIVVIFIKILGFLKQLIVAKYFGSTADTDIYFLAYGFENTIIQIAFAQLQVGALKIYIEENKNGGKEKASGFILQTGFVFLAISMALSGVIYLFSGNIAQLLAPTYSEIYSLELQKTIRFFSVVTIFSPIITLSTTVLNANKSFVKSHYPTFIAIIVEILVIVLYSNKLGIIARNWAYVVSTAISACTVLIMATKFITNKPVFNQNHNVLLLIKMSIPLMLGNGMSLILTMVDRTIGSTINEGSVSALNYSGSIYSILISIVSTGLVTVLTTYFTECVANGSYDKLLNKLQQISKYIYIPLLCVCSIAYCLSDELIYIVFGRGLFDQNAVFQTSQAVKGYIIASLFVVIKDIFVRAHYALGDTKHPVINNIISGVINVPASIFFMKLIGVGGITLGTALAELVAMILCLITFNKAINREINFSLLKYIFSFWKLIVAAFICIIMSNVLIDVCQGWNIWLKIIVVTVLSSVSYVFTLFILKCEELKIIAKRRTI